MATEVLLMADVKDLGKEGEVVNVADGYARNYLVPKHLAAPVTEATRRRLAKIQREREESLKEQLASAQELANRIVSLSCTIPARTSDEQNLYGSVSETEIAAAMKDQGVEIDRDCIKLEEHIKTLGVYEVPVVLHPDVETTVKVWVVEE